MIRKWILAGILLPCLLSRAWAAERSILDTQTAQQQIVSGMNGESQSLLGGFSVTDATHPSQAFGQLWQNSLPHMRLMFEHAVSSVSKTAVVMLLCGCAAGFQNGSRLSPQMLTMAGALGITSVVAGDIHSLMYLCTDTSEQLTVLSETLLPVVLTSVTLSGAPVSGAAVTTGTLFALNLCVMLVSTVLIPAAAAYIAILTVNTALGNGMLSRAAEFVRWASAGILKILVTGFIGYVTVVGAVGRGMDSAAVRTTRFALSASVPVVGGILSSATETVLASASVLKSTIGLFGMLCVLAVCILPFLRIAMHYLVFRAGTALLSPICPPPLLGLMDGLTKSLALVLGMLGSCCMIVFFELVFAVAFLAGA